MLAAREESSGIAYSAAKALIRANVTLTGTGWFPNLRLGPLPFPDDCFSHSTSDSRVLSQDVSMARDRRLTQFV